MSKQHKHDTKVQHTTEQTEQQNLPENSSELFRWFDEQPAFFTVERTQRVSSRDSGTVTNWGHRDKTFTETRWLNPDYEVTSRACHGTQAEVMEAWENMEFPAHRIEMVQGLTGAYHYTWSSAGSAPFGRFRGRGRRQDDERVINFDAVQHPDGHGVVQHYNTIAAIRTRNGLVLTNEQDRAGGFARLTTPSDADAILPLTGIEDVISDKPEDLYDISEVSRDAVSIRPDRSYDSDTGEWETTGFSPRRTNEQNTLIRFSTGAAVLMLIDTTANNRNERKCAFYIPKEEAPLYDTAAQAARTLQPVTIQQAVDSGRFEITPADEFAGGGATFGNSAQLGDTIIRQGEWYIVPMTDDFTPNKPTYKPLPVATRDSKWDFSTVDNKEFMNVDDVIGEFPEECPNCDASRFEIDAEDPRAVCMDCHGSFAFGSYEIEDFADESLVEKYKDALDVLGSHRPRDLVVDGDDIYLRGTFRHVDNEHQMVNLEDRWHLAVENTRDVTVFDLALDVGGVARYE